MALVAAVIGSALLADPRAEAAFDAPKRTAAILGIVLAGAALAVSPRGDLDPAAWWRALTVAQRLAALAAAIALVGVLVSTLLSPRRAESLHAARALLLFALLVPLGASRALGGARSAIVIASFLGACAANAVVSLLQSAGLVRLFEVELVGGRRDVSAFVGNDGVLALALALASVLSLGLVLAATRPAVRLVAAASLVLSTLGLAVNQSLTALMALATGGTVLATILPRRWAVTSLLAIALVVGGGVALHPTLARRAHDVLGAVRAGQWDPLVSYRLGAWAAAMEMTRARPVVGWGPGTFGAEFVDHRLRAELRLRRRLVNPFLAGAYVEAHSDYLQALAELGVPAGLAAIAAGGGVLFGLARAAARAHHDAARKEAIVLAAVLCAGAVAAITWFPFQRPITAVPLLLATGRAWRLAVTELRGVAR